MSEEPNGSVQGAPQAQATPQQPAGGTSGGDYETKLRNDPEFAVAEVKQLQSNFGKLTTRVQQLKDVEDVARAVGGGDTEAGSKALATYAQLGYQVEQNPQLQEVVQRALQSGVVEMPQTANAQASDGEYVDPEVQSLRVELQGLKQMLGNVQADSSVNKVVTLANDFRQTDIGQALTAEEYNELVDSWRGNVQTWSSAPNGSELVKGLSKEQLRVMALNHLDQKGKLQEVYGRIAAGKQANRRQFQTEGPGEVAGSEAVQPEFGSILEAFRYAKQEYS